MPGIKEIPTTGKISIGIIPIGADTDMVAIMTRGFIMSTIVARVAVGIEGSMMDVLELKDSAQVRN